MEFNTIRRIISNKNENCIGVVGTVKEFMEANIFESCDASPEKWCSINTALEANFGETKGEVLEVFGKDIREECFKKPIEKYDK